ncbi:hypothetical protein HOY80DRAFT_680471 [Tuber brumale]|nr:hypothetical protein HOY80DRAFT_680471 [Tuber brumale]
MIYLHSTPVCRYEHTIVSWALHSRNDTGTVLEYRNHSRYGTAHLPPIRYTSPTPPPLSSFLHPWTGTGLITCPFVWPAIRFGLQSCRDRNRRNSVTRVCARACGQPWLMFGCRYFLPYSLLPFLRPSFFSSPFCFLYLLWPRKCMRNWRKWGILRSVVEEANHLPTIPPLHNYCFLALPSGNPEKQKWWRKKKRRKEKFVTALGSHFFFFASPLFVLLLQQSAHGSGITPDNIDTLPKGGTFAKEQTRRQNKQATSKRLQAPYYLAYEYGTVLALQYHNPSGSEIIHQNSVKGPYLLQRIKLSSFLIHLVGKRDPGFCVFGGGGYSAILHIFICLLVVDRLGEFFHFFRGDREE